MSEIDFIAEAITDALGERCADYGEGCPTCEAWKEYDRLREVEAAVPRPSADDYREPGEFGEGATVRRAEPGLKIHSDAAWDVASKWSFALASDTRTLAAQIDAAIEDQIERLKRAAARAEAEKTGLLEVIKRQTGFDHGIMGIRSLVEKRDAQEAVLRKIAAYDDAAANAYLRATGSYRCFDEPKAVEMARGILEGSQ